MFESWAIVGPYPSWWLFNFLLLVLQVLHIIWSYLIARIAVKALLRGKVSHCPDGGGGWRWVAVGGCFAALPSVERKSTYVSPGKLSDMGSSIVQIFKLK